VTSIDRRKFLKKVETVAVGVACGGRSALPLMLAACGGMKYVTPSRIGSQLAVPLAELDEGSALVELDGGRPIHLRRLDNGEFSAVLTRCMHRGCQVEATADRFVCPCHGSEYSLDGQVLKGPTERPLIRYRVTSDDTRVYIHVDTPMTGSST
jgi:cytochrome b6-f complex iron-sulfur subunit